VLADRTYPFLMGVSPGSRWPGHDYLIFTWVFRNASRAGDPMFG